MYVGIKKLVSRAGSLTLGALALSVAASAPASATTIVDFASSVLGGAGGQAGLTYTDGSGVVAAGFYKPGVAWLPANLYVRNESDDHGLGVCNPDEQTCPGPDGGGDVNELDNDGNEELIRLSLPAGFQWVSVTLSSLDDNSKSDDHKWERGQVWSSGSSDPGDAFDAGPVLEFENDESEPTFAIPLGAETRPYLYFRPYDWRYEGENTNNDFLVWKVEIDRVTTPEPTSLGLLGLGLLALSQAMRRRRRNR